MANRYFNQFSLSLEKAPVTLWARVTIGSSGAPTLDAVNSKGIKSIVRNSAGKYTLTLGDVKGVDVYPRLHFASHRFLVASGSPAAPLMHVVSQAVATTSPTVVIQFNGVDGTTATDPASGEELWIELKLSNSSAR